MSDEQTDSEFMAELFKPKQSHLDTLRAIGHEVDRAEPSDPDRPDFDGGVRESASESLDPEGDHNNALMEMVTQARAAKAQAGRRGLTR